MAARYPTTPTSSAVRVLLLLNIQNDFFEGGQFPLPGADDCLEEINRLRQLKQFDYVVLWQTFHSLNHRTFCSNNPGTSLLEVVPIADLGPCVMWPDHCVFSTPGARLHPSLITESSDILLYSDHDPRGEKYSAIDSCRDRNGQSRLRQLLQTVDATELYVCGMAMEYAVLYTARDAKLINGLNVYVIEDACAGVSAQGIAEAALKIEVEQIHLVYTLDSVLDAVPNRSRIAPLPVGDPDFMEMVANSPGAIADYGWGGSDGQSRPLREVDSGPRAVAMELCAAIAARNVAEARALIGSRSATIAISTITGPAGRSPLHVAAMVGQAQLVELMIAHDVAKDLKSSDGETALHLAAAGGHVQVVQLLLIAGASVSATDNLGLTPLMTATIHGHLEAVLELLRWSSAAWEQLMHTSNSGMTCLMYAMSATRRGLHRNNTEWELDDMPTGSTLPGAQGSSSGGLIPTTHKRAVIVTSLLEAAGTQSRRLHLLRSQDRLGWSALHFGAKTGMLAVLNWPALLGDSATKLPINLTTHDGMSLLHIVSWNGRGATLALLLGVDIVAQLGIMSPSSAPQTGSSMPQWLGRIAVNRPVGSKQLTELDLALQRRFYLLARLLLRAGGRVMGAVGHRADKLLHYLIFYGDSVGVELLLRDEANMLQVTAALVDITKRIKYRDSCTFTFAGYNHPVSQHMFSCVICRQNVCLVCALKCHVDDPWAYAVQRTHSLQYLGYQADTHCGCQKDKCCALSVVDAREAEGYRYVPNPYNTSSMSLDGVIVGNSPSAAIQRMGQHLHDVWAAGLKAAGWTYGPFKDEGAKKHPSLLPHDLLVDGDRQWNLLAAQQTVLVMGALGYTLNAPTTRMRLPSAPMMHDNPAAGSGEPEDMRHTSSFPKVLRYDTTDMPSRAGNESTRHRGARDPIKIAMAANQYRPAPTDTSTVELDSVWQGLVELLAKNTHELWAECRMKTGWRYAPDRATMADRPEQRRRRGPTSPLLVPYELLTEKERKPARQCVLEILRVLIADGWSLHLRPGSTTPDLKQLKHKISDDKLLSMRQRLEQLTSFKQGVFNAFLFSAARRGSTRILRLLLSADAGTGALINSVDDAGRTPLFHAVQRSQTEAAQMLLSLNADVNVKDQLGITPLAAAAFQDSPEICEVLLRNGAVFWERDYLGLTPLHYSVLANNVMLASMLVPKLSIPGMPGVDFQVEDSSLFKMLNRLSKMGSKNVFSDWAASSKTASRDARSPSVSRAAVPIAVTPTNATSSPPPPTPVLLAINLSPMTLAVCRHSTSMVDLLLMNGADPLYQDGSGLCPYDRALLMHAHATADLLAHSLQPLESSAAARLSITGSLTGAAETTLASIASIDTDMDEQLHVQGATEAWGVARKAVRERRRSSSKVRRWSINTAPDKEPNQELEVNLQRAEQESAKLVESLSTSQRVQSARVSMAWRSLVRQVVLFLATMLLFGLVSPSAPDYPSTQIATYRQDLLNSFNAALPSGPISLPAWWQWFDTQLLCLAPPSNGTYLLQRPYSPMELALLPIELGPAWIQPSPDKSGMATMFGFSTLIGPVQVTRTLRRNVTCSHNWTTRDNCYAMDDEDAVAGSSSWTLRRTNITDRRLVVAPHRPSDAYIYGDEQQHGATLDFSWTDKSIASLSLQWGLVNPSLNVFAWTTLVLAPTPSGIAQVSWSVDAVWVPEGRFPPSPSFRSFVAFVLLTQLIMMAWGMRGTTFRRWLASGWNIYESCTVLGLLAVIIIDSFATLALQQLKVSQPGSGEVVDISSALQLTQLEFDVTGIVLLLLAVRFVKYARLTPGWGPMVVAIVMTWQNTTVLLYLGVALGLIVAIAIMFTVQLGAISPGFSTLRGSFSTLFFMLFAGNWDLLDDVPARPFTLVLFMLFVLFAIVLVNLFIGIVTDIYPQCREHSKQEWDRTVTALMEEQVQANWIAAGSASKSKRWLRWCRCYLRERPSTAQVADAPRPVPSGNVISPAMGEAKGDGSDEFDALSKLPAPGTTKNSNKWLQERSRTPSAYIRSKLSRAPATGSSLGLTSPIHQDQSAVAAAVLTQVDLIYAGAAEAKVRALFTEMAEVCAEPIPAVRTKRALHLIAQIVRRLRLPTLPNPETLRPSTPANGTPTGVAVAASRRASSAARASAEESSSMEASRSVSIASALNPRSPHRRIPGRF